MKSRAEALSAKSPATQSGPPAAPASVPVFESLPQQLCFAALLLALALAPAQFSGFWPASFDYLPQSLFSGLTAVAALLLALSPRPAARRAPVGWCLAGLFGWMLFSAFWTVYLHDTVLELARIGTCLAWFLIARDLLKEQFYARAGVALGAVTLGALWVVVPPILGFIRFRFPQLSGHFANNNMYANYCAMAFPCVLSFAFALRRMVPQQARPAAVIVGLGLAAVIGIGLVVSASKGGLLAVFAGSIVWLGIVLRARAATVKAFIRARRGLVIGVGLAVLVLGGAVGVKTVGPRLLAARTTQNNSTMFRLYTWRSAETMVAKRPLVGWGAATFPSVVSNFSETGYTRHAHHTWLQLAAESGVPAALFLAAACIVALGSGWRAARTARWNEAAAGAASLTAFAVHGCFDTGWGVSSIVLLLVFAFVLLDGAVPGVVAGVQAEAASVTVPPRAGGNLRLPWLGAVLVLGAAAYLTQSAASGEDLRRASRDAAAQRDAPMALRLAGDAVEADPLSARMRANHAQALEAVGNDADPDWAAATKLRPTDAQMWRQWAEYRAARGKDAGKQFDTAVSLAPNDSRTLTARGQWLLDKGDARGWKDFERITALLDAPYGLYPATPDLYVDMDAVRALLRLARRDIDAKQPAKAKIWLQRAAPMITLEKSIYAQQEAMAKDMQGTGIELDVPQDLDELEARLKELQAKL